MGATRVHSVSQAMQIMARLDDLGLLSDVPWQPESREALANVLHGRMGARVTAHLEARRTGSYTRHVLTALGLRPDGRKAVIRFRPAPGESQAAGEAFLNALRGRGLKKRLTLKRSFTF